MCKSIRIPGGWAASADASPRAAVQRSAETPKPLHDVERLWRSVRADLSPTEDQRGRSAPLGLVAAAAHGQSAEGARAAQLAQVPYGLGGEYEASAPGQVNANPCGLVLIGVQLIVCQTATL